ncbi:MAG TPA: restriction endonuclease subunit S [Candidatus Dormibacteraeota bacterium]|nr:restriction endonuclease subunit S [Candidatus Dormibacteraeota bacterium]
MPSPGDLGDTATPWPSTWQICKFGDLIRVQGGSQPPKSEFIFEPRNGYIQLLQIRDFGEKPVPTFVRKDSVSKFCEKHDIMIARYGASLGRILTGKAGAYNVALAKTIFDPTALLSRYVFYYLQSQHFQTPLAMMSRSAQNGFSEGELRTFALPLPPLPEQHRIVAKIEELFSELDKGIENLKHAKAQLAVYRQALLKHAFEGKLTPERRAAESNGHDPSRGLLARIRAERRCRWEEKQTQKYHESGQALPKDWRSKYKEPPGPDTPALRELPEGWAWASVEQLGDVQLGRQRAPQHHKGDHMRKYLRVANVYEDWIDLTSVYEMNFTPEEFKTFQLHEGDILLNEGQSLELVGRSAIYRNELPGACFTNTLVRFRAYTGLMPVFAQYYFKSCLANHRFRKLARWTTNIAHLGADRFADMEFPLPPEEEQTAIVQLLDAHLSVMNRFDSDIDTNLAKAEALRQSILKKAFSGQLVPQDPNDEPASALLARILAESEDKSTRQGMPSKLTVNGATETKV